MPEIGTSTAARATDTGDYEDDQTAPPASQEEGHQVQVEANQMQRTHANAHAQMHTCTTLHAYTLLETNEYTHTLAHTLAHTHTHNCTHSHTHLHTLAHTLAHTCTCTHLHLHTCTLALTHTCTCTHSHTHTHTHTHTNTHTHTFVTECACVFQIVVPCLVSA